MLQAWLLRREAMKDSSWKVTDPESQGRDALSPGACHQSSLAQQQAHPFFPINGKMLPLELYGRGAVWGLEDLFPTPITHRFPYAIFCRSLQRGLPGAAALPPWLFPSSPS